ncbi:PseudoU_synth_2 domain-containing protein, partial [Durusdinium trenchii]
MASARCAWAKEADGPELPPELLEKLRPGAFQGRGVLAIFKPAGVSSEAAAELLQADASSAGWTGKLTLVSRLDRQTSGVLPLAVGSDSAASGSLAWLQAQFAAQQ